MRRENGSTRKNLRFDYDAMGNRIAKHIYADNQFTDWEKSTYYVRDASGNVMAVYDRLLNDSTLTGDFICTERYIYGSSRIGMNTYPDTLTPRFTVWPVYPVSSTTRELGHKQYEISNHLGNVLSVITDQKLPVEDAGVIVSYSAVVITATDYSPFGVGLYGRSWSEGYRYGFNGKEIEVGLTNGHDIVDFGARLLQAKLGRWMSLDPKSFTLSSHSTYAFSGNSPVYYLDPEGETITGFIAMQSGTGRISRALRIASESSVFMSFVKQFNNLGNGDQIGSESGRYSGININLEASSNLGDFQKGLNVVEIFDVNKNEWVDMLSYDGDLSNVSKSDVRMNIQINENIASTPEAINTILHETILHGESTAELLSKFLDATSNDSVDLSGLKPAYEEKLESEIDHYKILKGDSKMYVEAQNEVKSFLIKPGCPENTIQYIPRTQQSNTIDTYANVDLSTFERRELRGGRLTLSMEFKLSVHAEKVLTYNPKTCGRPGNELCPKE